MWCSSYVQERREHDDPKHVVICQRGLPASFIMSSRSKRFVYSISYIRTGEHVLVERRVKNGTDGIFSEEKDIVAPLLAGFSNWDRQ